MEQQPDGLATFFPIPTFVTIAGRRVEVREIRLRQYPEFAAAVQPVWGQLLAGDYLSLLAEHRERVVQVLVMLTDAEPDWIGDLGLADAQNLTAAVFEGTISFFARSLFPRQLELAARMRALNGIWMQAPDGAQPSPSSPGPDTALPNAAS